jgi:hypothetical protein
MLQKILRLVDSSRTTLSGLSAAGSKQVNLELELRPNVSVYETPNTVTAQTQRVLETLWVSPTL